MQWLLDNENQGVEADGFPSWQAVRSSYNRRKRSFKKALGTFWNCYVFAVVFLMIRCTLAHVGDNLEFIKLLSMWFVFANFIGLTCFLRGISRSHTKVFCSSRTY